MAKQEKQSLFRRLTKLFRNGPVVKKKIRTADTAIAVADKTKSSGTLLFQKSMAPTYATITANAYNLSERLMRYQDFQEMEYTAEIASALDIYADETCAQDEKGRVLHIFSDNEKVKETLEDLFYDTLNVEFNLRSWARNLVKYGDLFVYVDVSPQHGIINAFPIPVNEIEREENYDKDNPFAVRFRWVTLGNRTLENWEIAHFRLLGNDMFLPYGSSIIEPARRIWRQLILIEDAMLVYRVVRAPERRVFYIDVANIPAAEVPGYVEEQKKNLRTNQVVDRNTGRVDLRYNPLSVDEDYFIPVRGGESGTKIETLAGGQNAAAVEDVAYIQKKLFAALKIPRAYLGYDEMLSSKATLAQEDIRFSRTINVIQKTILAELNKLAIIHLYAHGFTDEDLTNFTLRLSNPSTIAQQQKLELWKTKFEIAGAAPEGQVSKEFVRKEIWGLNAEQCRLIDKQRKNEKLIDSDIENASAEGGSAEAGGGEDLFSGGEETGGEEAGGEETEAGEENAADDSAEQMADADTELLTSSDNFEDIDFPINVFSEKDLLTPNPRIGEGKKLQSLSDLNKRSRRNARRRVPSGGGHMRTSAEIRDKDKENQSDISGLKGLSAELKEESVTEATETVSADRRSRIGLSPDMMLTLAKMSNTLNIKSAANNGLLSETLENNVLVIDEITDD